MVGFGDLPLVFSTVGEREAGRGVGGESDESGLSSQGLAEGLYRKKDGVNQRYNYGAKNTAVTKGQQLQLRAFGFSRLLEEEDYRSVAADPVQYIHVGLPLTPCSYALYLNVGSEYVATPAPEHKLT